MVDLVKLVVHVEVLVALIEPGLVSVCDHWVRGAGQQDGRVLGRHVCNAEHFLVREEADLPSPMRGVGSPVHDTRGVVRVSRPGETRRVVREATGKGRSGGGLDINHVQPAAAGVTTAVGADHIGEARLLVDGDVVGTVNPVVDRERLNPRGRLGDLPQSRQVHDLHSVALGLIGHDEGVAVVYLDVAPAARKRTLGEGEERGMHRTLGVLEVHERGPLGMAHERPLRARHRIGPAPHVVHYPFGQTELIGR